MIFQKAKVVSDAEWSESSWVGKEDSFTFKDNLF